MTGLTLSDGQSGLPSSESTSSYWHTAPSKVLQGHRTTPTLPSEADVLVIGSGITGAFAAKFLKEGWAAGKSVVMLEAREACWGATGRNGGHCQPLVYGSSPAIAAFEIDTFHYLRNLVSSHSIPCDWRSTTGVHALFSEDLVKSAAAKLAALRQSHPELASAAYLVTRDSTHPSLADLGVPHAYGAVVQCHAAALWPYKLVAFVLEDLLARFSSDLFNLQTGTPVEHLQRYGESWIVHTPRGQIVAKQVVVATGGYISKILPAFTGIITPVRGQVAALLPNFEHSARQGRKSVLSIPMGREDSSGTRGDVTLDHTYVFLAMPTKGPSTDDYLIQANGGRRELIYGGGRLVGEDKGWGCYDDSVLDKDVSAHLKKALQTMWEPSPETRAEPPAMVATFEWTGIMGYSYDSHPWVGEIPARLGGGTGLWICAGYTGHGMPVATLAARAVVNMMGGGDRNFALPDEYRVTEERVRTIQSALRTREPRKDDGVLEE